MTAAVGELAQLAEESRLADPRLALDRDGDPVAVGQLVQQRAQPVELRSPTDGLDGSECHRSEHKPVWARFRAGGWGPIQGSPPMSSRLTRAKVRSCPSICFTTTIVRTNARRHSHPGRDSPARCGGRPLCRPASRAVTSCGGRPPRTTRARPATSCRDSSPSDRPSRGSGRCRSPEPRGRHHAHRCGRPRRNRRPALHLGDRVIVADGRPHHPRQPGRAKGLRAPALERRLPRRRRSCSSSPPRSSRDTLDAGQGLARVGATGVVTVLAAARRSGHGGAHRTARARLDLV